VLDRANRPATSDGTPSGWIGSFTGADGFVASLAQFVQMVERVELIAELYGDREAALLYECVTRSPAGVIRTAEFFRLDDDGRIGAIRLVFDATELRKLMPPSAESRITHCPWRWPGDAA
jgi:hypothetical protein